MKYYKSFYSNAQAMLLLAIIIVLLFLIVREKPVWLTFNKAAQIESKSINLIIKVNEPILQLTYMKYKECFVYWNFLPPIESLNFESHSLSF